MLKKKLLLLLILVLFAIAGCSNTEPKPAGSTDEDYLKALASLEQNLLKDLLPLTADIRSSYDKWRKGEISRQEFNSLCEKEYIPKVNSIKAKYKEFTSQYPIPESVAKNPAFTNGLNSGKVLRSDVGVFLVKVVRGNGVLKQIPKDGKVSAKDITFEPLSDEELKKQYQDFMVDKYNKDLKQLETAISQYKKE